MSVKTDTSSEAMQEVTGVCTSNGRLRKYSQNVVNTHVSGPEATPVLIVRNVESTHVNT